MTSSIKKNFVLVHGAARGSRSWGRVLPLLEKQVHSVTAIDPSGRAGYGKPGWRMKLEDYADAVVNEVRKIAAPTILVGHSMGGQVISAAAEKIPDRIERLVYVAAFLPRSGDSIVSLGREDTDSSLPNSTITSVMRGTFTIKPTALAPVFCGDCAPEDIAQALREAYLWFAQQAAIIALVLLLAAFGLTLLGLGNSAEFR